MLVNRPRTVDKIVSRCTSASHSAGCGTRDGWIHRSYGELTGIIPARLEHREGPLASNVLQPSKASRLVWKCGARFVWSDISDLHLLLWLCRLPGMSRRNCWCGVRPGRRTAPSQLEQGRSLKGHARYPDCLCQCLSARRRRRSCKESRSALSMSFEPHVSPCKLRAQGYKKVKTRA